MSIEVHTNARELGRILGGLAKQELPYASANALTSLAFMVQKAEKKELQHEFKLRNRYSINGVQVNKADKGAWPNIQSEVGVEKGRSYLIDHVFGATRQGGAHGRATPDEKLRGANGRITKKNRPKALIKNMGTTPTGRKKGSVNGVHGDRLPFLVKTSGRTGNEVLVRRMGNDRYPLQILYAFKRNVKVKRVWEIDTIAAKTVAGNYYPLLNKALAKAIATAKPKAERSASMSAGTIIRE